MSTETLVQAVKDHALVPYNDGGWDVIVECWSDAEIAEQIGPRVRTPEGAIKKFTTLVSIWADRQADAIDSAF